MHGSGISSREWHRPPLHYNGKATIHTRSQAVNEVWSSFTCINGWLQSEHGNHSGRNIFHLNERHFFSQTNTRSALENCEFEGTLWNEMALFVHPSLGLELETVGAPDGLHSTHGVLMISHPIAFAHKSPVWQEVVVEGVLRVEEDRRIKSHRLAE